MSELEDSVAPRSSALGGNPVFSTMSRTLAAPQVGALLTLAMGLTLGVGLIMWALRPEFIPLTEQQSRQDALQIMEILNKSSTPYKLDPKSGLVLVPKAQAAEIQLSLAASGLLQRDAVGLEVLQKDSSLGTSHFTETARYQHALETELSRTISSMRSVESARVHLALPKQSVFVRDREQASASVMIKPLAGRVIEDEQVNAVTNLVASSIPYLQSDQVTIVDQWGRLLSTGNDTGSGFNREQYQHTRRLEKLYSDRIVSLLTPVIGAGRVRAIVTAEIDFSTNERTEENFNPDPLQLRSAESQSQRQSGAQAAGIPGALTNQPPEAGTIAPNAQAAVDADAESINESVSELKNYELDKTITHTRQAPGSVRRLTAAVIIDDQLTTDEAGEVIRTPLSEEELSEYTALAQEAIGFDENRGDSVVVFNRSFQPAEEILPIDPLPIWQQTWLWTMVRQVLIGLSVLLLILLVVRPAFKRLVSQDTSRGMLTDGSEEAGSKYGSHAGSDGLSSTNGGSLPKASLDAPPAVYGDILNMARVMAAEDPKRVAKVVKDWVKEKP